MDLFQIFFVTVPNKEKRTVFYPGDTVNVIIELSLERPKTFNKINIHFKGKAKTEWDNPNIYLRKTVDEYDYFEFIRPLIDEKRLIKSGVHTFYVHFDLPKLIPESFKGAFGEIYYEAVLVESNCSLSKKQEKFKFIVERSNDVTLKKEPPYYLEKSLKINLMPCYKKIELTNGQSYKPGDKIPLKIHIQNNSDVNINQVKIKLLKLVSYEAYTMFAWIKHEKFEKIELLEKEIPLSLSGTEFSIKLPSNIHKSNISFCKLIVISYALEFSFKIGSREDDTPKYKIPISIGEQFVDIEVVKSANSFSERHENFICCILCLGGFLFFLFVLFCLFRSGNWI